MDRIYRYNPNVKYHPNQGSYLQQITAKDLYIQNITVSENDDHTESFQVMLPNVLKNYFMEEDDKKMKTWKKYNFDLWQCQLNFATFCASSACGVSVEHLKSDNPLVRSVYRFHVYYHVRRILNELEVALPEEDSFNQYKNQYSREKYIKLCHIYNVPNVFTEWRNEYYFSSHQSKRPEYGNTPGYSYIDDNSWSRWIIERSEGLTTIGIEKVSESVRDYAYLILTSQTSTRSSIIGHTGPALDAQTAFKNNFENIINRRVDIAEDIQRFQKTLQYARSKVDFVVGENIYMLPSDMNLQIGNINSYNNKILVSEKDFIIGTNLKVNLTDQVHIKPVKKETKVIPSHKTITTVPLNTGVITHEEEKEALIIGITGVFSVWWFFIR